MMHPYSSVWNHLSFPLHLPSLGIPSNFFFSVAIPQLVHQQGPPTMQTAVILFSDSKDSPGMKLVSLLIIAPEFVCDLTRLRMRSGVGNI